MTALPGPSVETTCRGERLALHARRAVHWIARRTLFVADVHLGKEAVFGRLGVPIPHGPSEGDLDRLAGLVSSTGAERLCILGDFMHDAPLAGERWLGALTAFLDDHATLAVEVVAGNHDRVAGRPLVDPRIRWIEGSVVDGPFVLRHEPGEDPRGYVLAGHVHPAFRIGGGRRGESLRAPAYWFREHCAVLPAFGAFTGGETIRAAPGERVFVVGPDCVVPVFGEPEPCGDRPPARDEHDARSRAIRPGGRRRTTRDRA